MGAIKTILDSIFKLPPVEDRPDIRDSLIKKVFCPQMAVSHKDDTYIYYLFARTALQAAAITSVLYIITFLIDPSLYAPTSPVANELQMLFVEFSRALRTIVLLFILPVFIVKLRYNLNPKTYDVLWFSKMSSYRKRSRLSVILLAVFIMFVMGMLLLYIDELYLWTFFNLIGLSGFLSLLLFMFFAAVIITSAANWIFISLVFIWRYTGKYQGR